jgi:hypothetical protein
MSKKIYLAFALIALSLLSLVPSVVFAQWEWIGGTKGFWGIAFGPDVPEWATKDAYSVLQWLIFPFLSLWVVLYGILAEIRIFRGRNNWINAVLSFLIGAVAGPTGGLIYFVRMLFVAFGIYSMAIFAGLLFVGTFLWGRLTFIGLRHGGLEAQIKRDRKIRELKMVAENPNMPASEREAAAKELNALIKEEKQDIKA